MNYKNNNSGEVISENCYKKLWPSKQAHFTPVDNEPTHRVDLSDDKEESDEDDGSFIMTAIATEVLDAVIDDATKENDTPPADEDNDSFAFGGGSFDGGGAGGDF